MTYMLSYYVLLPLIFVAFPLAVVVCFFICPACGERRKQAADELEQFKRYNSTK